MHSALCGCLSVYVDLLGILILDNCQNTAANLLSVFRPSAKWSQPLWQKENAGCWFKTQSEIHRTPDRTETGAVSFSVYMFLYVCLYIFVCV